MSQQKVQTRQHNDLTSQHNYMTSHGRNMSPQSCTIIQIKQYVVRNKGGNMIRVVKCLPHTEISFLCPYLRMAIPGNKQNNKMKYSMHKIWNGIKSEIQAITGFPKHCLQQKKLVDIPLKLSTHISFTPKKILTPGSCLGNPLISSFINFLSFSVTPCFLNSEIMSLLSTR